MTATGLFPVMSPAELDTRWSVPVSSLIAGDTSGLLVPLYTRAESPEPNFVYVSTYLPGQSPTLVIPVYSSRQAMMSSGSRPVSAITASNGS